MIINDKLKLSTVTIPSVLVNGVFSSAAVLSTCAMVMVQQTTAGIITTLPIGAPLEDNSILVILNTGTTPLWVNKRAIMPNMGAIFQYNNTSWKQIDKVGGTSQIVAATGTFLPVDQVFFGSLAINMTGTTRTSEMNIGDTINVSRRVGATGTLTLQGQSGTIGALNNTQGATTSLAAGGSYGQHASFMWDGTNLIRINNG